MGGRKAGFNTNRSEFTHENALDGDIEYQRTGGCFVTTRKAIVLAIIAILALIAVGAVIYFYGSPSRRNEDDAPIDIEKLLNNTVNSYSDVESTRLPSHVQPLHYRLRIHPYLEEPNPNNFTFTGRVTIILQITKPIRKIIFHSEDLQIFNEHVKLSTTKDLRLRSLSQIKEPAISAELNTSVANASLNITEEKESTKNVENNKTLGVHSEQPEKTAPMENTSNADQLLPAVTEIPTVAGLPQFPVTTPLSAPQPSLNVSNDSSPVAAKNDSLPSDKENVNNNLSRNNDSGENAVTESPKLSSPLPSPATFTEYSSPAETVYKTAKIIPINIRRQEENKEKSTYVIYLSQTLQPDVNYTLDIQFSGKILNNYVGLYKTSYTDSEGYKRWLATTQLQPIFARRVFPCFDEPSFRSSFEISIARKTSMTTLSNMALKESELMVNQTDWVWDHFEKSPPMSPHLVAFTVCDFESLEPPSVDVGPDFKIWAPKKSLTSAHYAVDITPKILSYLQNYFGVKYPLSKIDFVVIPELPHTATENWGLISFRDTSLLLDPNSASWKTKNHVFKTIVSKLTSQWFGNLVTMEWWSERWLTDGFSTYMEDVVENAIAPELEALEPFALRIMQAILDSDKLKSVRSLYIDVKDSTQIEQLFDDIPFNKGSCLIRMLNYTITETLFKKGIQNYLKKWTFKSSNQDNFWNSLTEITANKNVFPADVSVKTFMDSWIKQEGYPAITVTRDYNTGNALINQSRFVLHGNVTHSNLWYIPLTYTKQNDNNAITTMWLKHEQSISTLNFTEPGNSTWVIFNVDQAGFYRVNYDVTNWRLLQNQLLNDPGKIMPSNRGQILNDAFELANAGILDYKIPLELTKYLASKERNYIPWLWFYYSLQALEDVIGRTQYNGIFQQYIVSTIKPLYEELGTSEKPEESQKDRLLRKFIIKMACSHNYEPCLEWAKQKYQEWMSTPEPDKTNPIPFDFYETVQCTAIKLGGNKEWEFLWNRTLQPLLSPINLKLAYLSLGCTREPWIINSYLEKALNGEIATQNTRYVWKSVAHPIGLDVGFAFLRSNWERIYDKNEHVYSNLKSIFDDFLSKLSTEIDLEDLTVFYKHHKENLNPISTLILSVVDRLKWRILWTQSHMDTIVTWLLQNITK